MGEDTVSLKRFAFSTRLCSTVLCLSFLAFPAFLPSPANAARIAVIVLSPQLGPWDRLTSTPRVTAEIYYLEYLGYKVYIMRGSVDNILLALAEPQVRAISYFGHAAYPSMENLDANSWRFKAFQFLQGQYIKQGLSQNDAYQWAGAESQNGHMDVARKNMERDMESRLGNGSGWGAEKGEWLIWLRASLQSALLPLRYFS